MYITTALLTLWAVFTTQVVSLEMQMGDEDSMKDGLSKIAKGLMDYYDGKDDKTAGEFVDPYYWWEAGAAWGSMLDYWYYTGDDTYNKKVKKALLAETGQNNDYMPSSQTTTEGNDDQGFWGITVMAAAERKFSNPKKDQPQWLALAQAVFNTMTTRWDTKHCGGGLRWQIYTWNSGYDYKNSVSNGCMFNLACRLYRYTGNDTYSKWANRIWDWAEDLEFLHEKGDKITVYDGGHIPDNCSNVSNIEWTYNNGLFLSGAAAMYNKTEDDKWFQRTKGLWGGASTFFKNGVMYEAACQPSKQCKVDQRCFKGIFSRFCGLTAQMVPKLGDEIVKKLTTSADAAAKSCSGGSDSHTCGLNWFKNKWDGKYGLGEQMSALEVMQNTLATQKPGPVTNDTGGTSKGNPNAGSQSSTDHFEQNKIDISTGDRAGAGILTAVVVIWLLGSGFWMIH